MMNFNRYAKKIYAHNQQVGWWPEGRCLFECFQLVSTEVAEATEGVRKNLMDDKLPHRPMIEVELADALIRVLDFGAHLGMKVHGEADLNQAHKWCHESGTVAKQLLGINAALVGLGYSYDNYLAYQGSKMGALREELFKSSLTSDYECLVMSIVKVANNTGCFLESAMIEKLVYNETRPDHKLENRQQGRPGDKQF